MAWLRDLERFFRKKGIVLTRQEGSHRRCHRPDCFSFTVSVHPSQEIYRALLAKILKDAGHTLDDFRSDPPAHPAIKEAVNMVGGLVVVPALARILRAPRWKQ